MGHVVKMKILMLNTLYPPHVVGGAERSVALLADALANFDLDISVITLKADIRAVEKEFRNKVKIYYLPLRNLYFPFLNKKPTSIHRFFWHLVDIYNPLMARLVAEIIRIEEPDIFHTHVLTGFSIAVWSVARKQNIPVIHSLRDYSLLCPRSTMFKNRRNCPKICMECKLFATYKIKATHFLQGVIGNSQFILNQHLLNGAFENISSREVIYNAYNPDEIFQPSKIITGGDEIILGYFGRLEENKGIELLLKTFTTINLPKVHLWVGGKGLETYESKIKKTYNHPRIRFLGFIKPYDFYPNINILVQPSLWHEPLSRTIIEAYSWGKPVLVSNRGGSPEIVENGETGLVFDPDNPGELQDKIKWLVLNPQIIPVLGQNARVKSKEFLPEIVADRHLSFYRKILEVKK